MSSNEFHLYLHRPDVETSLLSEVKRLREDNKRLQERLNEAEIKYGIESQLCNELIDALRERHIPFRDIIDRINRE